MKNKNPCDCCGKPIKSQSTTIPVGNKTVTICNHCALQRSIADKENA